MRGHDATCECGCGNPAPIAKRTRSDVGHVKGEPIRFIRGHYGRRRQYSDKERRERKRKRDREHYQRNKERIKSRVLQWQRSNPEAHRKNNQRYRENNRDHVNARKATARAKPARTAKDREWVNRNRDKVRTYKKRYEKRNPHVRRAVKANRRARCGGRLPGDVVQRLMDSQGGRCVACDAHLKDTGHHLDHIVPLVRGGTNTKDNVQLLCPPCNWSKGARTPEQWRAGR